MSVQWADPPPVGGPQDPRAVWMERLRLVKEHPMRWAKVASGTPSGMNTTAGALRRRQYHVPPGGWEFAVRTYRRGVHVGDQHVAQLFARFLGEDANDAGVTWLNDGVQDKRPRDDEGRLICPECSQTMVVSPGHTKCPTHGSVGHVRQWQRWREARNA